MKKKKMYLKILRVLPIVIRAYFHWVLPFYHHPEKTTYEQKYAALRHSIVAICKRLGFSMEVEGAEKMNQDGVALYVGDHTSLTDPLFYILLSKKPLRFVTKKENVKIPIVGKALQALGCAFLDREAPRQALQIFDGITKELQNGVCSWVIFPEGTRNKKPYEVFPAEFHAGSLKLATRGKVPLRILSLFGPFHLTDEIKARSCLIQAKVHEDIPSDVVSSSSTTDLALKAHDILAGDASEFYQKDKAYYESGLASQKARKWYKEEPFVSLLEEKA